MLCTSFSVAYSFLHDGVIRVREAKGRKLDLEYCIVHVAELGARSLDSVAVYSHRRPVVRESRLSKRYM